LFVVCFFSAIYFRVSVFFYRQDKFYENNLYIVLFCSEHKPLLNLKGFLYILDFRSEIKFLRKLVILACFFYTSTVGSSESFQKIVRPLHKDRPTPCFKLGYSKSSVLCEQPAVNMISLSLCSHLKSLKPMRPSEEDFVCHCS
jgi:hypothetical protein